MLMSFRSSFINMKPRDTIIHVLHEQERGRKGSILGFLNYRVNGTKALLSELLRTLSRSALLLGKPPSSCLCHPSPLDSVTFLSSLSRSAAASPVRKAAPSRSLL